MGNPLDVSCASHDRRAPILLILRMGRYVMDKRILYIAIVVLMCPLSATFATNYYLSPSGSDGNNGLSTGQAWATLQHAKTRLSTGDTLFIMGGTYSSSQYYHNSGVSNLTFKAYGDSQAVFKRVGYGADIYYEVYFLISGGSDGVTIDGFSHLDPDSPGWLKFESSIDGMYYIEFHPQYSGDVVTDWCENITVRGVILEGDTTGAMNADRAHHGICAHGLSNSLIEYNTIKHIYHPTGPIYPGDGTDRSQGTGDGILIAACRNLIIRNNRVMRCNHCGIDIGNLPGTYNTTSRFVTIKDNVIEQYWGGGIYLTCRAEYCLVDNNIIVHCGATTPFNKPGIQVSGPSNVIRRNVIYNPENQSIDMEAQHFPPWHYVVDNCMVYNNTVFGSAHGYSLKIFANNMLYSDCSAENILVANNIFYKSVGQPTDINATPEIIMPFGNTNEAHNWITPESSSSEPASTHWGGCVFSNNCIRRNEDGASHYSLIAFVMDATYGGATRRYSLDSAQGQDPIAWHGNTGIDPMIISEDPDGYGLFEGWWHLSPSSQLINAGTWVNDTIGPYVESMSPGYGWGNLSYLGGAPDIGAHESSNEDPAPLSSPNIRIDADKEF